MTSSTGIPGVSVVVCCHNSTLRLGPTLAHLAAQQVPPDVPWEVVVVDNASTDDTAGYARAHWPADAPAPLRVVAEPTPGLSAARRRGIAESRYEYVSFVDDDNWVCRDWVSVAYDTLASNPTVVVCGGPAEGVFETPPPDWFKDYQGYFAVGSQHLEAGDATDRTAVVWGAGLTFRKSAWEALQDAGFQFSLTDRVGTRLTSCGDHEVCLALKFTGGRLRYEPRLRLQHYMPAGRINWRYVRRLLRASGWSRTWLDPYREVLGHQKPVSWLRQVLSLSMLLCKNPVRLMYCLLRTGEGQTIVAAHEQLVGRLAALLGHRRSLARLRVRLHQQFDRPLLPREPNQALRVEEFATVASRELPKRDRDDGVTPGDGIGYHT